MLRHGQPTPARRAVSREGANSLVPSVRQALEVKERRGSPAPGRPGNFADLDRRPRKWTWSLRGKHNPLVLPAGAGGLRNLFQLPFEERRELFAHSPAAPDRRPARLRRWVKPGGRQGPRPSSLFPRIAGQAQARESGPAVLEANLDFSFGCTFTSTVAPAESPAAGSPPAGGPGSVEAAVGFFKKRVPDEPVAGYAGPLR